MSLNHPNRQAHADWVRRRDAALRRCDVKREETFDGIFWKTKVFVNIYKCSSKARADRENGNRIVNTAVASVRDTSRSLAESVLIPEIQGSRQFSDEGRRLPEEHLPRRIEDIKVVASSDGEKTMTSIGSVWIIRCLNLKSKSLYDSKLKELQKSHLNPLIPWRGPVSNDVLQKAATNAVETSVS